MSDAGGAVARLKDACDQAYTNNKSSCSNAVWDLIKALVNPKEEYRQANDFIDYWDGKWRTVDLEEGFRLANQGVVVGRLQVLGGHGHVIAIYPGTQDPKWWVSIFLQEGELVSDAAVHRKLP